MVDSTKVILPAAKAFSSGTLQMPETLSDAGVDQVLAWNDYPVNTILVILATLLLLLTLKILLGMAPRLLDSLSRWKACVNIEASVQLKGDRNILAVVATLPLALIADRYGLFSISLLERVPEGWSSIVTLGVILLWLFVRYLCYYLCSIRATRQETFRTAHKSFFNYWIVASILLVITAGIFSLTDISDSAARDVLLYEIAFVYLIAVLRKSQILRSYCGPLTTFLYLCALEFIPTGALIAGCLLL